MSAEAAPISHTRFAAALEDLPVSSLHAKISELRNSIAHLEKSNKDLEDFVRRENDKDCYEALMENKEVIKRMEERITLVKKEITEVRGLPLTPEAGKDEARQKGDVEMRDASANAAQNGTTATNGAADEQQNGTSEREQTEDGVYL